MTPITIRRASTLPPSELLAALSGARVPAVAWEVVPLGRGAEVVLRVADAASARRAREALRRVLARAEGRGAR